MGLRFYAVNKQGEVREAHDAFLLSLSGLCGGEPIMQRAKPRAI